MSIDKGAIPISVGLQPLASSEVYSALISEPGYVIMTPNAQKVSITPKDQGYELMRNPTFARFYAGLREWEYFVPPCGEQNSDHLRRGIISMDSLVDIFAEAENRDSYEGVSETLRKDLPYVQEEGGYLSFRKSLGPVRRGGGLLVTSLKDDFFSGLGDDAENVSGTLATTLRIGAGDILEIVNRFLSVKINPTVVGGKRYTPDDNDTIFGVWGKMSRLKGEFYSTLGKVENSTDFSLSYVRSNDEPLLIEEERKPFSGQVENALFAIRTVVDMKGKRAEELQGKLAEEAEIRIRLMREERERQ